MSTTIPAEMTFEQARPADRRERIHAWSSAVVAAAARLDFRAPPAQAPAATGPKPPQPGPGLL